MQKGQGQGSVGGGSSEEENGIAHERLWGHAGEAEGHPSVSSLCKLDEGLCGGMAYWSDQPPWGRRGR